MKMAMLFVLAIIANVFNIINKLTIPVLCIMIICKIWISSFTLSWLATILIPVASGIISLMIMSLCVGIINVYGDE